MGGWVVPRGGGAHICSSKVPFASWGKVVSVFFFLFMAVICVGVRQEVGASYCVQNLMVTLGRGNGDGAVAAAAALLVVSAI